MAQTCRHGVRSDASMCVECGQEGIAQLMAEAGSGDAENAALRERVASLEAFLFSVANGGVIVSSNAFSPEEIVVARAEDRMHVTDDGLGFIRYKHPSGAKLQSDRTLREKLAVAVASKDAAYDERNQCVAALAWLAIKLGYRVGVGPHEGPEDFGDWKHVVKIQFPTGQASWHFTDEQARFFKDLPTDDTPWDGHTTPEKYARLAALSKLEAPSR